MTTPIEKELEEAIDRVLRSTSRKKLIVAGPGTGKTTLFRKLLEKTKGGIGKPLVLTFINNLKDELHEKLSDIARVYTFHGYCLFLLHNQKALRAGLTDDFRYFPKLASLIKRDWELDHHGDAPPIVQLMRGLAVGADTDFYLDRSDYYDAVEFDDSVFRVHQRLAGGTGTIEKTDLVVVDEYQDFNRLEAAFIDLLTSVNPILIVGDDDQALYAGLRGSSHEFIRNLHSGGEYECFELPFCLRCPEVIVGAMNDLVERARACGNLAGRVPKPYRYYPPEKAADSELHPTIEVVHTTVQRKNVNYFGRYLAEAIKGIPPDQVEQSAKDGFPTALVIGSRQYLAQIGPYLKEQGLIVQAKEREAATRIERVEGLAILHADPTANLGWRIIIEVDKPSFGKAAVQESIRSHTPLVQLLPEEFRASVREEANNYQAVEPTPEPVAVAEPDDATPVVRLESFEGSKGLSAQHVFIVGLHEDELPKDAGGIKDIEICRLIVALTRTRKQCYLVHTDNFSGKFKKPSLFLSWIRSARKEIVRVTKKYWDSKA